MDLRLWDCVIWDMGWGCYCLYLPFFLLFSYNCFLPCHFLNFLLPLSLSPSFLEGNMDNQDFSWFTSTRNCINVCDFFLSFPLNPPFASLLQFYSLFLFLVLLSCISSLSSFFFYLLSTICMCMVIQSFIISLQLSYLILHTYNLLQQYTCVTYNLPITSQLRSTSQEYYYAPNSVVKT